MVRNATIPAKNSTLSATSAAASCCAFESRSPVTAVIFFSASASFAAWASVSGVGGTLGPIFSGWLLGHFWYGSVFLVNVPIVIIGVIAGLAVGYESSVWAILVIAGAVFASSLIYLGTNPTYIAYGVAMCGIGMLTLTGNNISMDVFGPVADNANGIGEMGYDAEEMEKEQPGSYKRARQILDMLRSRAGESNLPKIERDYIDRLLKGLY